MCKFESSEGSQAVTASEKPPPRLAERPTIGGLLRFSGLSPDSRIHQIRGQFAKSLQPQPRIFPFSGDSSRRLGSIGTARRSAQSRWTSFCHLREQNRESYSLNAARDWQISEPLGSLQGEACNVYESKLASVIIEEIK